MLPPAKRPFVDALYAHARVLDEIVDDPRSDARWKTDRLDARVQLFEEALRTGGSADPVLRAVVHTARTWDIPAEYFRTFTDAMRSDLSVTDYATYDDLLGYMHGAAALLGLQIVPVLETVHPQAAQKATAVGYALQITNILRDVEEDLERGRVYLPRDDMERHGVSRADLEARRMTDPLRALFAFEAERARAYYTEAHAAVGMLDPSGRECVALGLRLYAGILDSLEAADYQVFGVRHGISHRKAIALAAPAYLRSRRTWP
jgi:phytoene synthase